MLKLTTKYFGEIEYAQADVFHFSKGLFAFEEEKEFLLLPFLLLHFAASSFWGMGFLAVFFRKVKILFL